MNADSNHKYAGTPAPKKTGWLKRARHALLDSWAVYALVRALIWIVAALPRALAQFAGRIGGRIAYHIDRGHRALCCENLATAFPEKTPAEHRVILKACYAHLGRCAADFCRFTRMEKSDLLGKLIVPDPGALETGAAAFAEGRGVICVASHIGFWELSGFASRMLGYDIVSVSRKIPSPRLEEFVFNLRGRLGNRMVHQDGALREILRALKENRAAGILVDLHAGRESPMVPFFGKPASTYDTCAKLHLKTGAPLLRVLMLRRPDGLYRWNVKRIDPGPLSGTEAEKVLRILTAINASLEEAIRENPEQWVWMNKRWRKAK